MKKFKFSVVMAIYNVEKYLQEAIESVINQSIDFKKNIQLILVNDGSPDKSSNICKKYLKLYPENIFYIEKENGGVSSARNAGLKLATGKYINFLDSDDYFSKNAFERVDDFFENNPSTNVVAINLINFENSSGSWVNKDFFKISRLIDMDKEYEFMQCQVGASFIRRQAALNFEFDTKIKIHEDSHYLYRIFSLNHSCGVVNDAIYWHRIRCNKSSATQTINYKNNMFDLNKNVFIDLINYYIQKEKKLPYYVQVFILLEFNYYVINRISSCKFNNNELKQLDEEVNFIMSYMSKSVINTHYVLTKEDKKILLKIKNEKNILFLKKKSFYINRYICKALKKLKKIMLYIPMKMKKMILLDLYDSIDNLFCEVKKSKSESLVLENEFKYLKKGLTEIEEKGYLNQAEYLNDRIDYLKYKLQESRSQAAIYMYKKDLEQKKKTKKYEPLVSIVIPVYNGTNYIESAINSVLLQDYKKYEIIVVDDGSDDSENLQKIIKKYNYPIRYYRKENGGVSSALNFGIQQMKGEYFSWLSHDDAYLPNHLSTHINRLQYEDRNSIITYSFFNIIDQEGEVKEKENMICLLECNNYFLNKDNMELAVLNGQINGCNVLIPAQAFKKCGAFNEKLRYSQEKEMWSRLMKEYELVQIPFETVLLRVHDKSVTSKIVDNTETIDTLIKIIDSIDEETVIRVYGSRKKMINRMANYFGKQNGQLDIYNWLIKKAENEYEK